MHCACTACAIPHTAFRDHLHGKFSFADFLYESFFDFFLFARITLWLDPTNGLEFLAWTKVNKTLYLDARPFFCIWPFGS